MIMNLIVIHIIIIPQVIIKNSNHTCASTNFYNMSDSNSGHHNHDSSNNSNKNINGNNTSSGNFKNRVLLTISQIFQIMILIILTVTLIVTIITIIRTTIIGKTITKKAIVFLQINIKEMILIA